MPKSGLPVASRSRITGAVRQEHAVGAVAQDIVGGSGRRHDRDAAALRREHAQDVALGAIIDGDDVETRRGEAAIALSLLPARLVPRIGLAAGDLLGEVHALETRPLPRLGSKRDGVDGSVPRMN